MCIKLAKANFFFEKIVLSPKFGFFQNYLALFDTFTTRYSNSGRKFKFSDKFSIHKTLYFKKVFGNVLKGHFRPLWKTAYLQII